jgi:hypothetical protein
MCLIHFSMDIEEKGVISGRTAPEKLCLLNSWFLTWATHYWKQHDKFGVMAPVHVCLFLEQPPWNPGWTNLSPASSDFCIVTNPDHQVTITWTPPLTTGPHLCGDCLIMLTSCPLPQFFLYANLRLMSVPHRRVQRLLCLFWHCASHLLNLLSLPSPRPVLYLVYWSEWPELTCGTPGVEPLV